MLWWGQPTHALHEPQAHTTEDDQEAEQLNQSHKANWGPGGGREREKSFQLKPLDLPIRRIRAEGLCLQGGTALVPPSWWSQVSPPPLKEGPQNVQIYNNKLFCVREKAKWPLWSFAIRL